jgi:phosphate transport system substrate-binding protein
MWYKILLIISVCLFISCSSNIKSVAIIKIAGSDTMLELTEKLAEEYMKRNPGISIYVEGGGTELGVKSLLNSNAEIAIASRILAPEEIKSISSKFGTVGLSFLIAKDALSIYLNNSNKLNNLSSSNLKKIYLGDIKNWKEVGGENTQIIPFMRAPNSGTHYYFKQHILEGQNYSSNTKIAFSFDNMIKNISSINNSIGYGGLYASDNIKTISIDGIFPSEDNIRNNLYPITRYLYFHTAKEPRGEIKEFIDWVISIDGQKIIKSSGYISIWRNTF